MRKLRVVIVAGIATAADGGNGGQRSVALAILESELSSLVEFVTISSTMHCNPPPAFFVRLYFAIRRMIQFVWVLPSIDVALIFGADSASMVEKSVMAVLARAARRGVVLRLSSGYLPDTCRRSLFLRFFLRIGLGSANVVCSQGKFWTDYFAKFTHQDKIIEIPNAVVIRDRIREHTSDVLTPSLLYAGWLVRKKGIFELLEAMEQIVREVPGSRLTIAGSGVDRTDFIQEVHQRGLTKNIFCLGWVPHEQMADLYSESDIFIFPSHFEGVPNAVLEAMGCGVPVICTPVGSLTDFICDGRNGIIVPIKNPARIALAAIRLIRDPGERKRIGHAGLQTVIEKCDARRVWPIYAKALCRAAYEMNRRSTIIYETQSV